MRHLITVEEACELVTDGTHYTPKNAGIGIPFLTVKDVTDLQLDFINCSFITPEDYIAAREGNSAPQKGDVLFSKDGTVGKVHVVTTDRQFAVLSSLAILRPKKNMVDITYFGHVLRSPTVLEDALKRKTGSAIRRIILSDLKKVKIPLPSLEEQKRIADILDHAKILRAKRLAALFQLDELTQTIFFEMFGDSNFPKQTIGDLLNSSALLLHKDGNHGSLYPRGDDFGNEGIPFLSAKALTDDGLIDNILVEKLKEEKANKLKIGWINKGDVLLAHNASVGKVALYDGRFEKALIGTSLTAFRPNPEVLDSRYLASSLCSPMFQHQLEKNMGQTTRNQVPITAQRKLLIIQPPLFLQQEFARRITAVEKLKAIHKASLAELDELFSSLQYRAFRGEL